MSPRAPSRYLSKNALLFFVCQVIVDADALWEGSSPRAHSIRGVATCFFFVELVGLQGAGGSNLEIESSFCFVLLSVFIFFVGWLQLYGSVCGCWLCPDLVLFLSVFFLIRGHSIFVCRRPLFRGFGGLTADHGEGPLFIPCSPTDLLMRMD